MSDRDKLIELISYFCEHMPHMEGQTWEEACADYVIANDVTLQTTPISYERLIHIARQMHLWIFLNCADEQKAYDELKITAEENVGFGYGGKLEITMPEPPKEEA